MPLPADIRKRIERRAKVWRERHPDVVSALKTAKVEREGLPFVFHDPAEQSAVIINSDQVGRTLGAQSTAAGRRI
jgi:hypothetical protein